MGGHIYLKYHLKMNCSSAVRESYFHADDDVKPNRNNYQRGRIIDLSLAAACELRMVKQGLVKVRVEVLSRGI